MKTIRCRIPVLLIVVGLVMPTMPVAGDSCPLDSCRIDPPFVAQVCSDDGTEPDSCCTTDEGPSEDCCPHGCKCVCCDTAVVPLVRSGPSSVTIVPRSIPVVTHRPMFAPQDAVNTLLRPPRN